MAISSSSFVPSLEESKILLSGTEKTGCIFPIWKTISSDEHTPVTLFLKLTQGAKIHGSFLLESIVKGNDITRWSYVGFGNRPVAVNGSDPLQYLESVLDSYPYRAPYGAPPFTGGAVGYLGYECIHYFEPKTIRNDLPNRIGVPDAFFLMADTVIALDALYQQLYVVRIVKLEPNETPEMKYAEAQSIINEVVSRVTERILPEEPRNYSSSDTSIEDDEPPEVYKNHVTQLKERIVNGDIIQAVLTRRIMRHTNVHPFQIYRQLRQINPSPYMFFIDFGDDVFLVGASPECLCKVDENQYITNHPIAGTIRRGKTPEEDETLAKKLATSVKDRAEHVMLVDLARNDVNRVCDPVTVKVDSLMEIERFSHVMHLVSDVSGKLRPDKTGYDALRSLFPAGTLAGAPKIKAIQILQDLENQARGPYAGAVGRWAYNKTMDTCVAIRIMLFTGRKAHLQAGGGIVYDSVEEDEYVESSHKLASNVATIAKVESKN